MPAVMPPGDVMPVVSLSFERKAPSLLVVVPSLPTAGSVFAVAFVNRSSYTAIAFSPPQASVALPRQGRVQLLVAIRFADVSRVVPQ